jgi:putative transcriptional regulator
MKKLNLSFQNNEIARKGCLLISDPFLDDHYFARSVILLCEHNDEGSFGFVLNNYLELDLHKQDDKFPDIAARISIGGPMSKENLFFIHRLGTEITGATIIAPGIYYGGDFVELSKKLTLYPELKNQVRFFIGYSGWTIGQLKEELKEKSWIPVSNISLEMIFNTENDKLWSNCLELQGDRFRMISKFPVNPMDN